MGYLLVLAALLCGTTKGYCGKKTSGVIKGLKDSMLFSAVRMLLCIPIGLAFVLMNTGSLAGLAADGRTLLISALAGAATAAMAASWLMAVRKGAYMMVDVLLTVGVIVPVALCHVFFGEEVRLNHAAGIALLVLAAYVMCGYSTSIGQAKLTFRSLLVVAFCGISNGMISFAQKWFGFAGGADVSVFNFYTYVFAAAALFACWLCMRGRGEEGSAPDRTKLVRLGVYVSVMALTIFLHSLFSTMAAGYLTSAQLYPLMQGGGLTLSMLMSRVLFREKITPRCVAGIGITFAALMIINLL